MQLYEFPAGLRTAWFTAENPKGLPGAGARRNKGAKGSPAVILPPGGKLTLMRAKGPGVLRRLWLTCSNHENPEIVKGLRLRLNWEGAKKPAVDCPLGDFFGMALGRKAAFESALFADPEGRSFNAFVPMPFHEEARAELANTTKKSVTVFYQADATLGDRLPPSTLYFHALSRSESPNRLGRDYTLLPKVKGRGRFLGCNIGLREDRRYAGGWFGEGEIKAWLDGDKRHPSLAGTGTEDYIGTAWGQGKFSQLRSGCTLRDDKKGEWCFYRLHTDDPVLFEQSCEVRLQVMGGAFARQLAVMKRRGAPLKPVTVSSFGKGQRLVLEKGMPRTLDPGDWVNFWRQDHVESTAYYYLDRP